MFVWNDLSRTIVAVYSIRYLFDDDSSQGIQVLTSSVGNVVDCGGAVSGASSRTGLPALLAMRRGADSSSSNVS